MTKGMSDGIALQILLRIHYDTMYGIFDHEGEWAEQRPLAIVAMHEKEKTAPHSMFQRTVDRFVKMKVRERSGMSWREFCQLPYDEAEYWFAVCVAEERREASQAGLSAHQRMELKKLEEGIR